MKQPKGEYAWTAKVGEKGQIVIPKQARDVFDIKTGDTLLVMWDEVQGVAILSQSIFTQLSEMVFDGGIIHDLEKEDKLQ